MMLRLSDKFSRRWVGFASGFLVALALVGCSSNRSTDYYDDYLYERGQQPDNEDMTHEERVAEQKEIIRRQEDEIKRQDRELEDLRRQKFHNQSLKRYSVR